MTRVPSECRTASRTPVRTAGVRRTSAPSVSWSRIIVPFRPLTACRPLVLPSGLVLGPCPLASLEASRGVRWPEGIRHKDGSLGIVYSGRARVTCLPVAVETRGVFSTSAEPAV